MIPIAANPLQPLINLANEVLVFLHDDVGMGWGPAIVVLTFITRVVILPLSIRQIRSMRALQGLQPQIKEVQEKYGQDRQRLQREMMRVYQENNVNPLASCLPLLLQLPVFLALFYLLRSDDFSNELREGADPGWLFIPELDEKATGGVLVALLALYLGTQLAAGFVSMAHATGQQRVMMFALPLIITPFIISFPAGLVVYWISTNVWTVGQQFVATRIYPPPKPQTAEEVAASRPPPPPPRKRKRRR